MTGPDEQEQHDRWKALGIRTDIPHPARVYDYLLGGKDNFAVDREAAEMSLKISPEILHSARANRQFLVRAVRFLRDNGIRQFLDVGTGLPTSPNTYEVAQAGHPDELDPDRMHAITAEYAKRGTVFVGRSKEAIQRMFNGTELVDPGVVLISYWRPDNSQPDYNADQVWGYCGVARV
jgi:hypothetical protein